MLQLLGSELDVSHLSLAGGLMSVKPEVHMMMWLWLLETAMSFCFFQRMRIGYERECNVQQCWHKEQLTINIATLPC